MFYYLFRLGTLIIFLFITKLSISQTLPYLKKNGEATQLMVHEKPFLMLAAELHNSSSSSMDYMRSVWGKLKDFHLNSLIATVSWELFEPEEGKFDYLLVDSLIMNARKHNLKLALIWFGSWKNGGSTYVPTWVKKDTKRFFRVKNKEREDVDVLSPFCYAARKADAKAYRELMKHIREIDDKENTVVIMQVENEVGLFLPQDYNEIAHKTYESQVPAPLITYLQKQKGKGVMDSYLEKSWANNGYQFGGTWPQVFGYTPESFEFLTAWQYASYINEVAEEGKKEYSIPMCVNAWLVADPSSLPGTYPNGGPVSRVMDIYKVAAPEIDFQAPDIYSTKFKEICNSYHRSDNPLFIPEHKNDPVSAATNAVWAITEHDAICFSPFGIESMEDTNGVFAGVYEMLNELAPIITKYQGTGQMRGILRTSTEPATDTEINMGGTNIRIKYVTDHLPNYGLIIQIAKDEYLVAGNGFEVLFLKNNDGKNVSVANMTEIRYIDGTWKSLRRLNGDETCGNGARVVSYYYDKEAPVKPLIVKIKTYLRE